MESDAREGRPPGVAGARQAARPAWVRGPETNTEGSSNPMNCAVMMCVHAGRRVKRKKTQKRRETTGQDTQRERGGEAAHGLRKKNKQTPGKKRQCTARGHTALREQAAGEKGGAIGARGKKWSCGQAPEGNKQQGGVYT